MLSSFLCVAVVVAVSDCSCLVIQFFIFVKHMLRFKNLSLLHVKSLWLFWVIVQHHEGGSHDLKAAL